MNTQLNSHTLDGDKCINTVPYYYY